MRRSGIRYTSIGVTKRYGLDDRGFGVLLPTGETEETAVGPTRFSTQFILRAVSPEAKGQLYEDGHSHPCKVMVDIYLHILTLLCGVVFN
jgi:hypothetical protein